MVIVRCEGTQCWSTVDNYVGYELFSEILIVVIGGRGEKYLKTLEFRYWCTVHNSVETSYFFNILIMINN